MSDPDIPEPDRLDGVPHPRDAAQVFGQEAAEAAFLGAFASGRLHHGWLLTGPQGVGKATLAWQIARFLLAAPPSASDDGLFGAPPPPQTLHIDPEHPVARRIRARSEPRMLHVRRGWDDRTKRLKTVITVDEVRKLKEFFALSATDGGRRAVLVDAADEMNPQASNALLKVLEEPPKDTVLLLIAHQPARLLPTIRSRCRELRLAPLGPEAMAAALAQAGIEGEVSPELAELAGGSVRQAVALIEGGGRELYAGLVALMAGAPSIDRPKALKLAESLSGRGAEARLDLFVGLADQFLARLARAGAGQFPRHPAAAEEAALLTRLAPDTVAARAWADAGQDLGARVRRGRAVNVEPGALVLDMLLRMARVADTVAR